MPALPPDTTPAAIRDALIDEERAEFERAYQEAMAEAARTLERADAGTGVITCAPPNRTHRPLIDECEHLELKRRLAADDTTVDT